MKLLLIYNPHAGQSRAGKHLAQVESMFQAKGIETELHLTKQFGHGSEIVGEADLSHYDGIVAAGGDGTVFEVINGYSKNGGEKKSSHRHHAGRNGQCFCNRSKSKNERH